MRRNDPTDQVIAQVAAEMLPCDKATLSSVDALVRKVPQDSHLLSGWIAFVDAALQRGKFNHADYLRLVQSQIKTLLPLIHRNSVEAIRATLALSRLSCYVDAIYEDYALDNLLGPYAHLELKQTTGGNRHLVEDLVFWHCLRAVGHAKQAGGDSSAIETLHTIAEQQQLNSLLIKAVARQLNLNDHLN